MSDNNPKSIWNKSWKGRSGLLRWLISLMVIAFVLFLSICLGVGATNPIGLAAVISLSCALIGILLFTVIRWGFHRRNFGRFLFGLACLITLIALFYAEEDWRGKHDWEKFKRQWEAKGEHFSFASMIPPPVPDDQNFAMAPIWVKSMKAALGGNAFKWFPDVGKNGWTNFVDRLDMEIYAHGDPYSQSAGDKARLGNWQQSEMTDLKPWQNYYRTLAARTNLFPVAPKPQTPARDALLALSRYNSAIEELREASRRPYSQFPVYSNPDRPFDTLLPHLAALKRCGQVLELRAIAELRNDQTDAAFADVKLMFYLVNSIRTEPFLISQLVRIALLQITIQPVYEGLAGHKWSDAQLAELDSELAGLDFLADYEHSMRGERACGISAIDYLRKTRDLAVLGMPENSDDRWQKFVFRWIPGGWFYLNELVLARMNMDYLMPLVNVQTHIVSPDAVRRSEAAEEDFARHGSRITSLAQMTYPALSRAAEKFAWAQDSADLTRVAIALERYRQAHGQYPESLDALTPGYITKLPHDIINGLPLHYRRTTDGQFVLYSVGWNETDDGGVVAFTKGGSPDFTQGDWVWRYPGK